MTTLSSRSGQWSGRRHSGKDTQVRESDEGDGANEDEGIHTGEEELVRDRAEVGYGQRREDENELVRARDEGDRVDEGK